MNTSAPLLHHAPTGSQLQTGATGKPGRIMLVDDEPTIIKVAMKHLQQEGYTDFIPVTDSREALSRIRNDNPDVVLLDVKMPHVSGIDILEAVRSDSLLCHIPVLMLTAETDDAVRIAALNLGATDFLTKPVSATELTPRVRNSLLIKRRHDELAAYSQRLERDVRERTLQLSRSRQELIHVLACAAEHRDQETGNHVLRVGRFAGVISRSLGLSEHRAGLIEQAAILHDVGKIGIPDSILLKPGKLDDREMNFMQRHCEFGMRILQALPSDESSPLCYKGNSIQTSSPVLNVAAVIANSHHEKWDGSGYPNGLAGDAIPLEGRITAVADVFDALTSRRPYKEPMPLPKCIDILIEGRGAHFDPAVLEAFFNAIQEIVQVAKELKD